MIRFLSCFLGTFLIGLNVGADDRYNITVTPSDTLSADVINDIHDRLGKTQKKLELPQLIGEWFVLVGLKASE